MSEALMTIGEFAEMLGPDTQIKGAPGIKFSSVSFDSRSVRPNGLFFAIEGERDGHEFVQAASDAGAAAAVVTHFVPVSLPQVLVKDTREALLDSAKKWRSKFDLPVIAVAGSNGKTTTTQMVLSIIKERFQEGAWVGTEGNLNNELGVSLMLWKLRPEHQAACFEVGMNHIGEMRPLVSAIAPTIGTVTNTMRDHQEFLASLEETAKENGEVFAQLPRQGVAVINAVDPFAVEWRKMAGNNRVVTLQGRRTGVGITAEGDMIAALGLRYGTEEATDCAELIQKTLALAAYRSSVMLAKERGAFGIFDAKREEKNPFINRLREADPALYEDMLKYGRRNIACLTIAPTGTTSLMTQTTSGIEPVFLPVYKRRRKVNPNDSEARVDFVDETGDAFEEYIVFHHKFVTWMQANGYSASKKYTQEEVEELVAKSPYYKATSNDVDWLQKVRMQGRIQKWVDHSISVTINLPNDVSEELVDSLYVEAWRCGCKGCTVYRDGSRSGVLIATDKKKKKEDCNCMQPPVIVSTRPRELDADVVKFQNNREKWIAFVGLLNGRPYEIFTGLADDDEGIMLPKNVSKGTIIKSYDEDGNKHYDFQFKNKRGYKMTIEGLDGKFNPEYWNYAKLISGVLRYGMPIDQVIKLVQGMELNSESINTWKNGVERALKKYLPNGMEAKGQKCPNCGLETLIYQEGCLICTNCGASKCG